MDVHRGQSARGQRGAFAPTRGSEPLICGGQRSPGRAAVPDRAQHAAKTCPSERDEPKLRGRAADVDRPLEGSDCRRVVPRHLQDAPEVRQVVALAGLEAQSHRRVGRPLQVDGGVVEAPLGARDLAEDGIEVIESPIVTDRSNQPVGVGGRRGRSFRITEEERGVDREHAAGALVPDATETVMFRSTLIEEIERLLRLRPLDEDERQRHPAHR